MATLNLTQRITPSSSARINAENNKKKLPVHYSSPRLPYYVKNGRDYLKHLFLSKDLLKGVTQGTRSFWGSSTQQKNKVATYFLDYFGYSLYFSRLPKSTESYQKGLKNYFKTIFPFFTKVKKARRTLPPPKKIS